MSWKAIHKLANRALFDWVSKKKTRSPSKYNSQSEGRNISQGAKENLSVNKLTHEARENASDQVTTDFSFKSDWSMGWRDISWPIRLKNFLLSV